MPFAALQAGAGASLISGSRHTQQRSRQQSRRCHTGAAASRRSPSQLARTRQRPAASAAGMEAGAGAGAEDSSAAFGSVDLVEPAEAGPAGSPSAAGPAAPAAAAGPSAAAPSSISGAAAAAAAGTLPASPAAPLRPPSMRSEDIALGISVSSEEEEEAAEEAQSEVDTLKQEVSELRQLLIAQVGGRAALALWTGVQCAACLVPQVCLLCAHDGCLCWLLGAPSQLPPRSCSVAACLHGCYVACGCITTEPWKPCVRRCPAPPCHNASTCLPIPPSLPS